MTGKDLEPRQQSNARLLKTKTWYQMKPQPDLALLGCFAELLLSRFGFRENLLVKISIGLTLSHDMPGAGSQLGICRKKVATA